jgi:hypothetical protein
MSTAESPTSVYPDRSATLIVAGVLQILLGCFCLLMTAMMVAATQLPPPPPPNGQAMPQQAINTQAMIQATVIYLIAAVALIWMGSGLVRARRWAWTLTVVLSWAWLIIGAFSVVMVMCLMGKLNWNAFAEQAKMPPGFMSSFMVMMFVVFGCLYILIPGGFLLLCHHESVRVTCLRRDPKIPWTDRCPMPVLALSLFMALSMLSMLSLAGYRFTLPLFGVFVSGWTGAAVAGLIDVVLAWLAWGTYRLKMAAWWATLLLGIAGTVNGVIFIRHGDLMTMYEKMGMPADQLEMIRKLGMVEMLSQWGPWIAGASAIAWMGYLLYLRRYFVRGRDGTTAAA